MIKKLAKITLLIMRIFQGFADTALPNVKASIKDIKRCPVTGKNEYNIDWVRLISSFATFTVLILNFLGYTNLADIIKHIFGIKG
jgi:hypothetical protein